MKFLLSARHPANPIHPLATVSALSPSASISEPARTVLVVEDDPMVRESETLLLRLQGYTVLEAEGAEEALRLAREAAAIDLLITDFSIPEVNGLELTRRFRAVHPEAPVLMVSGSFRCLHIGSETDLDRFDFLAKPFQFDELLQKVRALLDAVATPLPIKKPWCCD